MRIDLNLANNQANQMRSLANHLQDARTASRSCRQNLDQHWRGQEMVGINNAMDGIVSRLAIAASELDAIAVDIIAAAQEVRRQEELAAATATLAREDANVANLRRTFDDLQRQHNRNPTPTTQTALETAQRNLNSAVTTRNNAAAAVRALNR